MVRSNSSAESARSLSIQNIRRLTTWARPSFTRSFRPGIAIQRAICRRAAASNLRSKLQSSGDEPRLPREEIDPDEPEIGSPRSSVVCEHVEFPAALSRRQRLSSQDVGLWSTSGLGLNAVHK